MTIFDRFLSISPLKISARKSVPAASLIKLPKRRATLNIFIFCDFLCCDFPR